MPGFEEGGGWDVGLGGTAATLTPSGDLAVRSVTANSGNGPYAPNLPGDNTVPTPAGVVTGKVWDWAGLVYNVMAQGAAFDGATNDADDIDQTFTAGAVVALPIGTGRISAPINSTVRNSARLLGAGRDATTLQLPNANNGFMVNTGATSFTIEDLTFDGNKANQTGGSAIAAFVLANKAVIRNTRFLNSWGKGISDYLSNDVLIQNVDVENSGLTPTSDGTGAGIAISGLRTRVLGSRVDTPNDSGIFVQATGSSADLIVISGNIVHNPNFIGIAGGGTIGPPQIPTLRMAVVANAVDGSVNGDGIDIGLSFDTAVVGNVTSANRSAYTGEGAGRSVWVGNIGVGSNGVANPSGFGLGLSGNAGAVLFLNAHSMAVVGNSFQNNSQIGLLLDSLRGDLVISGNMIRNNGTSALGAGFQDGINVSTSTNPLGNLLIIGNRIFDDQNSKTQQWGVNVKGATSYHVNIIHNDLRGNSLGAVQDLGLATYTHGNLGYNPRGFLAAPAPAATGVILYNPFNCDCWVYINGSGGAALTGVAVGGIKAPTNQTFTAQTTGGTLATGTYFYRISALNPQGETLASTETSIAVTGPTGSVVVKWNAVPGATGYNIYGRTTGAELKMVSNITATAWLDDGSITPAGALPGGDTTGNTAITGWTAAPAADSVIPVYVPWGYGIKVTYTTFVAANWQWFGL